MSGLAEELLREAMEKMDATTTHDLQHTERVYRIATHMALMEGADLELVQVAAALHDIGRSYGEPHAEVGAGKAAEILARAKWKPSSGLSFHLDSQPRLLGGDASRGC